MPRHYARQNRFNASRRPIRALVPSLIDTSRTLSYKFRTEQSLVDSVAGTLLSVTRSGSASRVNAQGFVEDVLPNTPRFDFDPATGESRGLLVEPSRTNIALETNALLGAPWTTEGSPVTEANFAISPRGALEATRITAESTTVSQLVRQDVTVPSDTLFRSISIFVKKTFGGTSPTFMITARYSGGTPTATSVWRMNTDTGEAAGTGFNLDDDFGDYWRFGGIVKNATGNTTLEVKMFPASAGHGNLFSDDLTVTGSAVAWGCQIETQVGLIAFPTSYMASGPTPATRGDEEVFTNDMSWLSANDTHTMYVDHMKIVPLPGGIMQIDDGTDNDGMSIEGIFGVGTRFLVGGTDLGSVNPLRNVLEVHRAVLALADGDQRGVINGLVKTGTVSGAEYPLSANMTTLRLGNDASGGVSMPVWIREVTYYNVRKSDQFLLNRSTGVPLQAEAQAAPVAPQMEALEAMGVTGTIEDGSTITITGSGFGTKPDPASRGTAKPILIWRSEDNSLLPNTVLGDTAVFDRDLRGSIDASIAAENSSFSYKASLGTDADPTEGFGMRHIVGDWDDFYVFRRELFTKHGVQAETLRTRTTNTSPEIALISPGDWGRSKHAANGNATGKVNHIGFSSDDTTIYWSAEEGDIAAPGDPATDFTPEGVDDDIDIYATQAEAESGSGSIIVTVTTNDGFFGTPFRVFNNKNIRFTATPASSNNGFVSNPYVARNGTFTFGSANVENTGGSTFAAGNWPNSVEVERIAGEWSANEWTWKWGTVDVEDGEIMYYKDGICAYTTTDKKFIMSSTAESSKFTLLTQFGNDNRFTQGTDAHIDYLYIDDSSCRVLISDSPTLNIDDTASIAPIALQPCPIVTWVDGQIVCVVQIGEHATLAGKFLIVVDSTNVVVASLLIS